MGTHRRLVLLYRLPRVKETVLFRTAVKAAGDCGLPHRQRVDRARPFRLTKHRFFFLRYSSWVERAAVAEVNREDGRLMPF